MEGGGDGSPIEPLAAPLVDGVTLELLDDTGPAFAPGEPLEPPPPSMGGADGSEPIVPPLRTGISGGA